MFGGGPEGLSGGGWEREASRTTYRHIVLVVSSLVVAGFGVGPEGQVGDFVRVIARGDDGRGPRIIYAGQQNRIRSYIKTHPDWYQGDRSELLRKLVQMEIDASAGEVGGPVDILAIGPQGPHWVQHKDDCR